MMLSPKVTGRVLQGWSRKGTWVHRVAAEVAAVAAAAEDPALPRETEI
jgi:hypothetical protein